MMNRMYKNKLLLVTELLFCNNPKVTGQPPPINLFLKTVATVHVNVCVCVFAFHLGSSSHLFAAFLSHSCTLRLLLD